MKTRSYIAGFGVAAAVATLSLGISAPGAVAATDSWDLYPDTSTTDTYAAQVLQPINADGSSVWPAKRGVIPVQFVVTETQTTSVAPFASIGSDTNTANDYSYLSYTPAAGTTVADLTSLVANYTWDLGTDHGGSLRWTIHTAAGPVHVYYGDLPNLATESAGNGSGVNLLALSDLRFDTSGVVGGTFYDTWAHAQTLVGGQDVTAVSLVLDGGWGGDQQIALSAASVNGSTFTMPSGTTTSSHQTNAPAATFYFSRTAGSGLPIDESLITSVQGDTGTYYRQVDGKYIYNLDLKALNLNAAQYRVFITIDGLTHDAGFGTFNLK